MDLGSLLIFTKSTGGSDLHLSAGAPPMIRVHGEMRRVLFADGQEGVPLPAEDIRRLIYELLSDSQKSRLEKDKELDCALTIGSPGAGGGRFRANVFFQDRGIAGVFRVISSQIKTCEELNVPAVVKSFADYEKGLVLVTGPTGSGKSTTLAAIIDRINTNRRGHIVTIEDPIEFVHVPKLCMVNQREVGKDTRAFSNALRSSLREDPDVILVGELRDLETIALAITAAETGHLVFGTLHTSSAAKTIDRIINVFPAGEQAQIRAMLSESLRAVVAQLLVPKRAGGRVAAHEILVGTTGVRAMIRDGKTHQLLSCIQTGAKHGMQSLEQSLTNLAVQGVIDREVASRQLEAVGLAREDEGGLRLATAPAPPSTARAPLAPVAPAAPAAGTGTGTGTRRYTGLQGPPPGTTGGAGGYGR